MVSAPCFYKDKYPYLSAWLRIEIAKEDGMVEKKAVKVGLAHTLAVYVFVGGDFGDMPGISYR
jgi:hypothetical protein